MSKTKNNKWLMLGLAAAIIAAPNAAIIKYTVNGVDPYFFSAVRFLLIAVVTTPFIIINLKKFSRSNLINALKAGLYMSVAVTSYVLAIKLSVASYVLIITLITPIFFIIFSAKLTKEKITQRAIMGMTMAAIGSMIIVLLPIAIKQDGSFVFYPWATVLALVNCVAFPLSIISFKKANEGGLPMSSLMSISSWMVFLTSFILLFLTGGHLAHSLGSRLIFGVIYSGLVVALVSRIMNIVSYEHIGGAAIGILSYLETFLAIIIPLIVLGEKLSWEMVLGGALILAGVYVIRYHKDGRHKRHFTLHPH